MKCPYFEYEMVHRCMIAVNETWRPRRSDSDIVISIQYILEGADAQFTRSTLFRGDWYWDLSSPSIWVHWNADGTTDSLSYFPILSRWTASPYERNKSLPVFWILFSKCFEVPGVVVEGTRPNIAHCKNCKRNCWTRSSTRHRKAHPFQYLSKIIGARDIVESATEGDLVASLPRLSQRRQRVIWMHINADAKQPQGRSQNERDGLQVVSSVNGANFSEISTFFFFCCCCWSRFSKKKKQQSFWLILMLKNSFNRLKIVTNPSHSHCKGTSCKRLGKVPMGIHS